MGAQAFRTPTGRAAEAITAAADTEAPGTRSANHAKAQIAADFKPGPEYRAYTVLDDLEDIFSSKTDSKASNSKGSADKPKGPSKPVYNPFEDHDEDFKPKSSYEQQPYPEPRPDYEPADDRQYKDRPWIRGQDKEDHLEPWIRGSDKDEEYKIEYQPYEPPSAQQQRPYDKEGSHDRPSERPAYERPRERDAGYVRPVDKEPRAYDKPSYDRPPYGRDDHHERPEHLPEERPRGREGPDSYSKDSRDDSYGGYKDDSYNAPDSYDSGYYGEAKAHICLQEKSRVETPDTSGQIGLVSKYTSTFQCCSPPDAPDACLTGNRTDSPYSYYSKYPSAFRSDSLLDTYLAPPLAATCVWEYSSNLCPPHLLKTCLGAGKLTCSLPGDIAKECGAPSRRFQFVAEGWFVGFDALSCAQSYNPAATGGTGRKLMADAAPATAPATAQAADPPTAPAAAQATAQAAAPATAPAAAQATAQTAAPATARAATQAFFADDEGLFSGVAWKFQGNIKLVRQEYGYQEGMGIVEFVTSFGQAGNGRRRRSSRRRLLADAPQTDSQAAAPAAATAPAATAPTAAAPAATASQSSAQAPAAAAAPAQGSADTSAAAQASTQAAAGTSTQTQAAAPVAAGNPTKVQREGFVDSDDDEDDVPYDTYDSYDIALPIVKGGSLHITLFDDYSDKDGHGY